MAAYGYALIFYLGISALFFFIPSALVSAELASGWPRKGGVYLWVKEAFGSQWGFVAIFMQWVENLPWFPAALAFMASAIAYIFDPVLASNKIFILFVIWGFLWGGTFLNLRGMKLSALLSSTGVITGTIIPGLAIIVLGFIHVLLGKSSAIHFSPHTLLPKLGDLEQMMLLAGMLMAISGMEMSAVHVADVENPKKNFPKAIFSACIIILFLSIVGSLSIAVVIPIETLSYSAGVLQAFSALFEAHNMPWATPLMAFFLAYGAFAMVITWMAGPSRGIREVATEGYFPKFMQKENKNGMPAGTLIVQAVVSTFLSLPILFMPTVSEAFWMMTVLAAQLYLVMYVLMFAAAIKLRYSHPKVQRTYKIPGGNWGMWLVSGSALLASFVVIFFGFIPTREIREMGGEAILYYSSFLFIGMIIFVGTPLFLHAVKKRNNNRLK